MRARLIRVWLEIAVLEGMIMTLLFASHMTDHEPLPPYPNPNHDHPRTTHWLRTSTALSAQENLP